MGNPLTEKEISILNGIGNKDSICSPIDIIKNKCNHKKMDGSDYIITSSDGFRLSYCSLCGKIIDLNLGLDIENIDKIDIDNLTVKELKSMIEYIKLYCLNPEEYEDIYNVIFNASLFLDKIRPICHFVTSKFEKDKYNHSSIKHPSPDAMYNMLASMLPSASEQKCNM